MQMTKKQICAQVIWVCD